MIAETQEVVRLTLNELITGENIRCELKPYKIESLAEQIQEMGGIHTALKVEPYANGVYMIREGYYRHAAARWLEARGVIITLPCIIEPVTQTRRERILKQLSENHDRENLSWLEISNTIHMLLEEGMSRAEIMQRFARPRGRGKTPTMQPLSEAAYSYCLRYRELPEEVQQMLHHGTIQVTAANRFLDESDPGKRAQLLVDAEQRRQQRVAEEDKHLEKLQSEDEKRKAAVARNQETVEVKAKEISELEKELARKKNVSDAAFRAIGNLKGEKKLAARNVYSAAAIETNQVRSHLRAARDEKKRAETDIRRDTRKSIITHREIEVAARGKKKRSALSEKDVQAAIASQNGRARLGAVDMRAAVRDWAEGPFPKVQAIAGIIQRTFDSVLTSTQAGREMAKVTGEIKRRRGK